MDSYRRISREAELLAGVIIKRLRAEGCTDEEVVAYLKAIVAPTSTVSSPIAKALANPGQQFVLGDGGVRSGDVPESGTFMAYHDPDNPSGEPRQQLDLTKAVFNPYYGAEREGARAGTLAKARGITEAAEAADHHDLTSKTRKARAAQEKVDRENRLRGR